ncbi:MULTISPECIES: hypothetical protein [unclassified Streptomyces]|uniref:hypothetical protein n=1 Tax=unclassified Streptomyces TaxID=2593676 RepID=UPI00404217BE
MTFMFSMQVAATCEAPQQQQELKRLRRAARTHAGQITVAVMCFVAEGLAHYWSEEASWHTDLQEAWAEFRTQPPLRTGVRPGRPSADRR